MAAPWVSTCLKGVAPGLERIILDGQGRAVPLCLPPEDCDATKAVFNHIRWPDGRALLDTVDQEPTMLGFLRAHPLPSSAPHPAAPSPALPPRTPVRDRRSFPRSRVALAWSLRPR